MNSSQHVKLEEPRQLPILYGKSTYEKINNKSMYEYKLDRSRRAHITAEFCRLKVLIRPGEGRIQILKLAVYEAQRLVSVLSTVTIVGRRIAAIAAVRIRSITVRLDLAVVRAASLAGWTGRELDDRSVSQQDR
jgi:hypothetical protein